MSRPNDHEVLTGLSQKSPQPLGHGTIAVIEQITIVSMNGPSMATTPSRIGSSVLAAECAIGAEPSPASLENTARLMPITSTPMKPPYKASLSKANSKIVAKAAGEQLLLPLMPLATSGDVVVQLSRSDDPICFESTFAPSSFSKNDGEDFKAKSP